MPEAKKNFRRARTPEHKAERFAEIMEVTDRLFQEKGFHNVSLTSIAKEMGHARGNLYKYAPTKEEIFLALYAQKNRAYLDDLLKSLGKSLPLPADEFAHRWAQATDRHHDYLRYQSILTSVIETNVSLERLVAFKTQLKEDLRPVVKAIKEQCPGIDEATAAGIYLATIYEACGLEGHLLGNSTQIDAMRQADMALPEGGFAVVFEGFIYTYLRGIEVSR